VEHEFTVSRMVAQYVHLYEEVLVAAHGGART